MNSFRKTKFHYEQVSTSLIAKIIDAVEDGNSVVLLGPYGMGKQLVLAKIGEHFKAIQSQTIRVQSESFASEDIDSVNQFIGMKLEEAIPEFSPINRTGTESWRIPLRKLIEQSPTRIIFLISNVDLLPGFVARSLLKAFRELTDLGKSAKGQVTILLTGNVDLAPLVHGADSEFTVRDQYVIQGFGELKFKEFSGAYLSAINVRANPDCEQKLLELCGGQLALFRMVIEEVIDSRRAIECGSQADILLDEILSAVEKIKDRRALFCDALQPPLTRVESSVESLNQVQTLIDYNSCPVPATPDADDQSNRQDPPTELELCGIAKRNPDRKLVWLSPLTEMLVKNNFTDWAFGDSFACNNAWTEAFESYRRAINEGTVASYRPRLNAVNRAFEAQMFRYAGTNSNPVKSLRDFFIAGAKTLLGFDEAIFWEFDNEKNAWFPTACSDLDELALIKDSSLKRVTEIIKHPSSMNSGLNKVELAYSPFALLFKLPEFKNRPSECITLSNFESQTPLIRERRQNAKSVLSVLGEAFLHARQNQQRTKKASIQEVFHQVIPNVLQLLDGRPERTKQALKSVGDELLKNQYRRVMFSVVDQQKKMISGVVDCRSDAAVDVARLSKWSLEVPIGVDGAYEFEDVQQKCVIEAETQIVRDARIHPLTKPEIVNLIDQKAIAIVPICYNNRVLGTMYVERDDQQPLDPDEIDAFESFASQLGPAIEATIWMDALEEESHNRDEAILIVDPQDEIKFVNAVASTEYNLKIGWQQNVHLAKSFLPAELVEPLLKSRTNEKPYSHYATSQDDRFKLRVVDVRPIRDWNKAISGYSIRVQNLDSMAQLLNAIQQFAACRTKKQLADIYLNQLQILKHEWGRFYEIDEDTNRLVGFAQFGLPEDSEGAIRFQNGTAITTSRREGGFAWRCIEEARPIVRTVSENYPLGEFFTSAKGIAIFNETAECPKYLTKSKGDCWVDLPLFFRESGDPIGKISIECKQDLTPEELNHLQILTEAASAGFAAIKSIEESEATEANNRRKEMLRVIGEVFHQLTSKIAALSVATGEIPKTSTVLKNIRTKLTGIFAGIADVMDSYQERLGPIQVQKERKCLVQFLQSIFQENLNNRNFEINCPSVRFESDFDPKLFRQAFDELILNAKKASNSELKMKVAVSNITQKGIRLCRIDVSDNGPGIPDDKRQRVFDELYSERPNGKTRGTGLGLSMVKSIVWEHGGNVEAVQSPLSGACIRIEIPRFEFKR